MAKLKMRAMRKSTIRRQESTFDLDKIKSYKPQEEVKEDSDELLTSEFDTSSDGSSSKHRKIKTLKNKISSINENSVKLSAEEKKKIEKETYEEIKTIIKDAKNKANKFKNTLKLNYGIPYHLCTRRHNKSNFDSPKTFNNFRKNRPKLRKTFYKTLENIGKPPKRLRNPSDLRVMKPSFQTASNFF